MNDKLLEEILNFVLNNMGNREMMHLNYYIETRSEYWNKIQSLEAFDIHCRNEDLEKENAELKKELELRSSWVKHHQASVHHALAEKHKFETSMNQNADAAIELGRKLKVAIEALEEIRNMDWGTDHCDGKNMIADKVLMDI
jgi:hypothetical protein